MISLRWLCILLGVALATSAGLSFAQEPAVQFYTDGTTIGGWIHVPEKSYDMTWHFAKADPNQAGWNQEIAVKYYGKEGIYYYDVEREREFKGYYDPETGKYFRLPPQFRRPHLEDIRKECFQELKEMPFLHDLFKKPCEQDATSGPRLDDPPTPPSPPKEWLDKHPRPPR